MANRFIEELRMRVPYFRRLHRQIDELRHRVAALEAGPELYPAIGAYSGRVVEQFRAFLRTLTPHDVVGFGKRRIGAPHDGGYVMLDDFGHSPNALSLGIGPEVSWDTDMAARGFRVFQYDHSVSGSPQSNPQFVFHRRRVVGRKQTADDITLAEILAQPELVADRDVIVKIDIDEAEWELFAQTDSAVFQRIRQLTVELGEIRMFVDDKWRGIMLAALDNLTKTHACIHLHGNNWGPYTVVGGIAVPNFIEATFVRRSDYQLVRSQHTFPTEHDVPNNPKRPDFYLGRWEY